MRGVTWLTGEARGLRFELPCEWVRCDAPECTAIVIDVADEDIAGAAARLGWALTESRDACESHA